MRPIRVFRVRNNWTLEKMAGMLEIDISSLSRIERGKQAITPALAVKLEAMSNIDRATWLWPKEGKNGRNKNN